MLSEPQTNVHVYLVEEKAEGWIHMPWLDYSGGDPAKECVKFCVMWIYS